MLAIIGGFRCADFINPVGIVAGVRRQTLPLYWVHLNRFHLKTETEFSIRNVMF
jgi:hypothetical protein